MADKNAEFRAVNNNAGLYPPPAAAANLYPPPAAAAALYPPAAALYPAAAAAIFPPAPAAAAAPLYPPPAPGAGEGFGYDSAPPPYYSLANPAFVAATGGFQVGAKLEAVDGIGSTEARKQMICVATIKAAAADRVLISFDGVGRMKRAPFLACLRACVRVHVCEQLLIPGRPLNALVNHVAAMVHCMATAFLLPGVMTDTDGIGTLPLPLTTLMSLARCH